MSVRRVQEQASSDSLPRARFGSGPGPSPGRDSRVHFKPLFSRDEYGDPLAVDSVSLAGEASSLLSLDWHPKQPRSKELLSPFPIDASSLLLQLRWRWLTIVSTSTTSRRVHGTT